jgi:hypothetical protein
MRPVGKGRRKKLLQYQTNNFFFWIFHSIQITFLSPSLAHNLQPATTLDQIPGVLIRDDNAPFTGVPRRGAAPTMNQKPASPTGIPGNLTQSVAVRHSTECDHLSNVVGAAGKGSAVYDAFVGTVVTATAGLATAPVGVDVPTVEGGTDKMASRLPIGVNVIVSIRVVLEHLLIRHVHLLEKITQRHLAHR